MSHKNYSVTKSTVLSSMVAAAALCFSAMASAAPMTSAGSLPSGWTGTGSYGTASADEVAAALGEGRSYGWVSTNGGIREAGQPVRSGADGFKSTDGSFVRTSAFSANAGDSLSFSFNYISSDGGRYADYGWVRLLSVNDPTQSTLLFTVRTTLDGTNIFDMTPMAAQIDSPNASISGGAPDWSPLGKNSGKCFDDGCGSTGWLKAYFDFSDAGDYILEFGVTGWKDRSYHSGLAFDGITVGTNSQVPEPASLALLGLGLAGLACRRRRQAA